MNKAIEVQIEDIDFEFVPASVLQDVDKRIADWRAAGGDTYMSSAQQYIKSEINEAQFEERCSHLERVPESIGIQSTYTSISEKFMQGKISEDEFVEQYNRLVEQDAEKHREPIEPHEHI